MATPKFSLAPSGPPTIFSAGATANMMCRRGQLYSTTIFVLKLYFDTHFSFNKYCTPCDWKIAIVQTAILIKFQIKVQPYLQMNFQSLVSNSMHFLCCCRWRSRGRGGRGWDLLTSRQELVLHCLPVPQEETTRFTNLKDTLLIVRLMTDGLTAHYKIHV